VSDRATIRREAISRTAESLRHQADRSGVPMTQSQAEARVRRAVERGDRIRANDNR
jgi:hypothetical protein